MLKVNNIIIVSLLASGPRPAIAFLVDFFLYFLSYFLNNAINQDAVDSAHKKAMVMPQASSQWTSMNDWFSYLNNPHPQVPQEYDLSPLLSKFIG